MSVVIEADRVSIDIIESVKIQAKTKAGNYATILFSNVESSNPFIETTSGQEVSASQDDNGYVSVCQPSKKHATINFDFGEMSYAYHNVNR